MLRAELMDKPDSLSLRANLAEALRGKAREVPPEEKNIYLDEAKALYKEAAENEGFIEDWLKKRAFLYTLEHSIPSGASIMECRDLCLKGLQRFPGDLDLEQG